MAHSLDGPRGPDLYPAAPRSPTNRSQTADVGRRSSSADLAEADKAGLHHIHRSSRCPARLLAPRSRRSSGGTAGTTAPSCGPFRRPSAPYRNRDEWVAVTITSRWLFIAARAAAFSSAVNVVLASRWLVIAAIIASSSPDTDLPCAAATSASDVTAVQFSPKVGQAQAQVVRRRGHRRVLTERHPRHIPHVSRSRHAAHVTVGRVDGRRARRRRLRRAGCRHRDARAAHQRSRQCEPRDRPRDALPIQLHLSRLPLAFRHPPVPTSEHADRA